MKILKKVIITILVIVAIPLLVALFIKKNYAVQQEIIINKSKQDVFAYIKNLKNQDNFSKWALMDPQMKKEYRGNDGNVGFVSAWTSDNKNVGKGEQEIISILEGERIDYELRFFEPWESTSQAYMITESVDDNKTKVVWGFSGKFNYPMNIMLLFMDMDKAIGDDFNTGLTNLKSILEKQ